MTRINTRDHNKNSGANKKLLRDRVNQIIRQGVVRAAEKGGYSMCPSGGVISDGWVYSSVLFNRAA